MIRGINYGHHWSALTGHVSSYNGRVASTELAALRQAGFSGVRIAYPTYDSMPATIAMCKDMVKRALEVGFQNVIWGVVGHRPRQTANDILAFEQYVKHDVLPWAQQIASDRLHISIGNEEEMHLDASVTTGEIQTRLVQLLMYVVTQYGQNKADHVTSSTYRNDWATLGVPAGARLGFNVYYELPAYASFATTVRTLHASFANKFYIAEYSTSNGFSDATPYGGATAEARWANALTERRHVIERHSTDSYIFCYKGGSFGLPADAWSLRCADGSYRQAWHALTGARQYRARTYSVR